MDFEIQRCSRRCAKTDREFAPGEVFHSVLIADGAEILRRDYGMDAWEGPPENVIGHWKSRMPEPHAKKASWAPNDVILHYFRELASQPDKQDTRYVLALLMIRRRIMRLESTETDAAGIEHLVMFCPRDEMQIQVPVVMPTPERVRQIQDELARLLFAEAA
jgi:hypothetical protein